ncbi:MAG: phage holin family protein [Bacteroidota bacterium]
METLSDGSFFQTFIESFNGNFILTMVVNALALLIAAMFLDGVEIKGFFSAVIVALVIAILNATIGIYLEDKTGFTQGILGFIVDGVVIMLASFFLSNFKVKSFLWAFILAFVLTFINAILFKVAADLF